MSRLRQADGSCRIQVGLEEGTARGRRQGKEGMPRVEEEAREVGNLAWAEAGSLSVVRSRRKASDVRAVAAHYLRKIAFEVSIARDENDKKFNIQPPYA